MESSSLSKYTVSFGLSLAVTSVINAVLVTVKEKSQSVMSGMARMTGHHWITHSLFIVLLFATLGFLFANVRGSRGLEMTARRLISTITLGVAAASLIIVGFYLVAD
jgi:hypothetical protein